MAWQPLRSAILCAALALALAHIAPASAQDLLHNGGFEQGTSGWLGPGISTAGCSARSGAAALAIPIFLRQNLASSPAGGSYTLTGWLKAQTGSGAAELSFVWLDATGFELTTASKDVAVGAGYAAFSFSATSPAAARGLGVRIETEGAAICVDDLGLSGPPPATATAPSQPSQQSSALASHTAQPTVPSSTATPRPSLAPSATSVPAASESAPSPRFVNGGFEDGLDGWSKFGGSLGLILTPVNSGRNAGQLTSHTDSTKWAYQTVVIDPALPYEFTGYVSAGPGVASAYLRISWYASTDGSGPAISTDDSTETIDATSDGFALLTTGAIAPPDDARSARPRVVMTPAGAAAASIAFDDLWFGVAAEPIRPQASSAEATALPQEPPAAGASQPRSRPRNDTPGLDSSAPGRADEVKSAIAPAAPADVVPSGPLLLNRDEERGVPTIWLGGSLLFFIGLGGSYLLGKHRLA